MKLSSSHTLESLKPVLQNPDSTGPNPVYQVFNELDEHLADQGWINQTVIEPGLLGEEYTKTFGHYHTHPVGELYKVVSGEGVMILQKKKIEGGIWNLETVEEVLLIHAKEDDEILIIPEYGHSWSNVGEGKLILIDNWDNGHTSHDYEQIEAHQGMAYYIFDNDGTPDPTPNPTYKDLPKPVWLEAEKLAEYLGRLE